MRGSLHRGRLGRSAIAVMGLQVGTPALRFVLHAGMARLAGAATFGAAVYALSVLGLLSSMFALGFNTALGKLLPDAVARDDAAEARGLLWFVPCLVLGVGLLGAVVVSVGVTSLGTDPGQVARATALAAWIAPVGALALVLENAMRGLGRPILPSVLSFLVPTAVTAVGLGALWASSVRVSPEALLGVSGAGLAGLVLVQAVALRRLSLGALGPGGSVLRLRPWLSVSLPILGIAVTYALLSKVDLLVLERFTDPAGLALYDVAQRVALFTAFGVSGIQMVLAPRIASLWAAHRFDELQNVLQRGAWLMAGVVVPVGLVLWMAAEPVLGLFGDEFRAGTDVLWILIVGQVANGLTGPASIGLSMTGHQRALVKILVLTLALESVLVWLLAARFGAVGAATASALAHAGWNLAAAVVFRVRTGLWTTVRLGRVEGAPAAGEATWTR